jgi:hypothetical protein
MTPLLVQSVQLEVATSTEREEKAGKTTGMQTDGRDHVLVKK